MEHWSDSRGQFCNRIRAVTDPVSSSLINKAESQGPHV